MTEIDVTPMEPMRFGVQVREGDTTTSHRVEVPDDFLDNLRLTELDPAAVVKESFVFLLEREPATSIMRQFSLWDIRTYFPEYPDELQRRLAVS